MKGETDDYMSDMEFGKWLRDQRTSAGLSIEEAAAKATLSPERLKSLELGLSERGITRGEAEKLSGAYRIALPEFLKHASG